MPKDKNPNSAPSESLEQILGRAENLMFSGQTKEAKAALTKAAESYPGDWRSHFGMVKFHTANFSDYFVPEERYAADLERARAAASEKERASLDLQYGIYARKRESEGARAQEMEKFKNKGLKGLQRQIEGDKKTGKKRTGLIAAIAGGTAALLVAAVVLMIVLSQNSGNNNENNTKTFTVSFDSNGGTPVAAITREAGRTVFEPDKPTRTGHKFDDWYTDQGLSTSAVFPMEATKNVTLYAKWIRQVTVTFNTLGGPGGAPKTLDAGGQITLQDGVWYGRIFRGWFTDEALTMQAVSPLTVNDDITLYAKWELLPTFTVIFEPNGGDIYEEIGTYVTGHVIAALSELELPTRDGFTFAGWYFDDEVFSQPLIFPYTITKDITLYAKWAAAPTVP